MPPEDRQGTDAMGERLLTRPNAAPNLMPAELVATHGRSMDRAIYRPPEIERWTRRSSAGERL